MGRINDKSVVVPSILLLGGLAGCTVPLSAPAPRFSITEAPANHSRLILPADIVLADTAASGGTEYARRDRALAVGRLDGDLAVPAFYEGEIPPNLWETRRLYLDHDPKRVLFFQPGYDRHHDHRRYWY